MWRAAPVESGLDQFGSLGGMPPMRVGGISLLAGLLDFPYAGNLQDGSHR